MIGQRYHEKKVAVLDVCRRYLRLRGETDDEVDADFLKMRIKALEDSRYVLAVVGEVKAGKSTFINALLGESILPTDFLQSSSAIVEIFKSEERYVEIEYADGSIKKFEDEAAQHLRQIGAIQDRYRDIPTTMIDAHIANDIELDHLPVDELETASGLRLHDKKALIQEYIETRALSDIPKKVSFGFPLKYAFDGLRLVDSPGVNARGGVQDVTYGYVLEANALLFVHSLESAIESSSFFEFVTDVVPNRALETLFLILTKSGLKSSIEIDEKVEEARQRYQGRFDRDRILHVDSMLKVISEEIEGFDSAAALKEYYREQKEHFEEEYGRAKGQLSRAEAVKFDVKLKLLNNVLNDVGADSDRETVRRELRISSNFDEMERIIDEISKHAPELQLAELLRSVKRGYGKQNSFLNEKISLWEKKKRYPQTFEVEIGKIQELLKSYERSMLVDSENIISRFTGRQAEYQKSLEKITSCYTKKASQASLNSCKKILIDFHGEMDNFANKVSKQVRSAFEEGMKQLGDIFKTEHGITVPTVDVSGIEDKATSQAYEDVKVSRDPDGWWEWIRSKFGKKFYKKERRYSEHKHLSALRAEIRAAITERRNDFDGLVRSLIGKIAPAFKNALQARIADRNSELTSMKRKKETNEVILKNIADAKQRKVANAKELSSVSDMLGDLE